jgi:hypothetical protein
MRKLSVALLALAILFGVLAEALARYAGGGVP